MKKRNLLIVFALLFATIFSLGLFGCKRYTDEENFAVWLEGRDYSVNYTGGYTYTFEGAGYKNGVLTTKANELEAFQDNKYYYDYNEYEIDEDGKLQEAFKMSAVIKYVTVDGIYKGKYVTTQKQNGKESVRAVYVSPKYAQELIEYSPQQLLHEYSLDTGKTYEEFCDIIKSLMEENGNEDEVVKLSFVRNSKNSVTFKLNASYKIVDDDYSMDENYQYTKCDDELRFTISDGKFTKFESCYDYKYFFSDKTKNFTRKQTAKSTFSYSFDQEHYDSLNADQEATANYYMAKVKFVVEGYDLTYATGVGVGENYTATQAKDFLTTLPGFIIFNGDKRPFFEIYTDSEMTTVFDSTRVTDEKLTLYIKLILPEDKAMVVTVENYKGKTEVILIHVLNKGFEFSFSDILWEYDVLTLDGNNASDKTGFTCDEQKIYLITCVHKTSEN